MSSVGTAFTLLQKFGNVIPLDMTRSHDIPTRGRLKTLIFFDLESTGLYTEVYGKSAKYEKKSPRITEIAMDTYDTNEYLAAITCGTKPRSSEKRLWQIDPELAVDEWTGGEISGLTPSSLHGKGNLEQRWPEISYFLNSIVKKPACLLAHNGRGFDFKLLVDEIERFGSELEALSDDIYVADTMEIIKGIEKEYNHEVWVELDDNRRSAKIDLLEEDSVACRYDRKGRNEDLKDISNSNKSLTNDMKQELHSCLGTVVKPLSCLVTPRTVVKFTGMKVERSGTHMRKRELKVGQRDGAVSKEGDNGCQVGIAQRKLQAKVKESWCCYVRNSKATKRKDTDFYVRRKLDFERAR